MTTTIEPTDVVTNGVSLASLAHDLSWGVDFELIDNERPFGPEYTPVKVREIHSGGAVYGFLVSEGLPGKDTWLGVSELVGDENWHVVESGIEGTDDELDRLGRAVIADQLVRGHLAKI